MIASLAARLGIARSVGRSGLMALLAWTLAACQPGIDSDESARKGPATSKPHWVEIIGVEQQFLSETVTRTGSLRARRLVRLYSQEEGRIVALPFFEGDQVQQGDLLVQMDDRLLRAQLSKAEAHHRQARQDLERLSRLLRRKMVAEDERLRAQTAVQVRQAELSLLQTRLSYTMLTAPFAGIITERLVEPGDAVPRHLHLLTVADPSSLITRVTISELLLTALAKDDPVAVSIDALGHTRFVGKILRIHPNVDPQTRQGVVEIALDPVPQGARAGQLCRVEIRASPRAHRVIPLAALRRDANGEFAYRLDAKNSVHRAPVRSGLFFGDLVEILEGLEEGDQVVTKGFLGLHDGKRVETVPRIAPESDVSFRVAS